MLRDHFALHAPAYPAHMKAHEYLNCSLAPGPAPHYESAVSRVPLTEQGCGLKFETRYLLKK